MFLYQMPRLYCWFSRKAFLRSSQIWYWPLKRFLERIWTCCFYLLSESQQLPFRKFQVWNHQSSGLRRWFFRYGGLVSRQRQDSWHWPSCRYWARLLLTPGLLVPGFLGIKLDNECRAPWQSLHHYQLPAWRLSRPTLVFWRFWAVSCNMALLLVIIAFPVAFLTFDDIVSGGRRRVFLVLLLLFLAIRLDGLIGIGRSGGLAVGLLCFFGPGFLGARFLGSGFLGLHFWENVVGWAVAFGIMDIRFPIYGVES